MTEKAIIPAEVETLIEDSCEALIRFYSEILNEKEPNETYIEAHRANMLDALMNHGVESGTFTAGLIQTLCCTIIKLVEESEEE